MDHQLRSGGQNGGNVVPVSQYSHQPGARAQRRFTAHSYGARRPRFAANNHQLTVVAFVRGWTPRRQPAGELRGIEATERRRLACQPTLKPQGVVMQTANDIAGLAGQQPRLKRDKGEGMSGMDNRARRRPRLRIQAGGNIQRHNRSRMGVCPRDQRRNVFPGHAL